MPWRLVRLHLKADIAGITGSVLLFFSCGTLLEPLIEYCNDDIGVQLSAHASLGLDLAFSIGQESVFSISVFSILTLPLAFNKCSINVCGN